MLSSRRLDGDVAEEERADGELADKDIMDVNAPERERLKPRDGGKACGLDDDGEGSDFLDLG